MSNARNTSLFRSLGFSLVEVMVAVTIMSGILYVSSSVLIDAFKQQTAMTSKDNAHQFISSLAHYLNNQALCTGELQGKRFPEKDSAPLTLSNYSGFAQAISNVGAGTKITDDLELTSLTLTHKQSVPHHQIGTGSSISRVYVARIEISLRNTVTDTLLKTSYLEFPVVTNAANIIQSCQVGADISSACHAMGMSFNPTTQECVPDTTCIVTGTYSTTTCNPTTYGCDGHYIAGNPTTGGGSSCPSGSSARLTGELVYTTQASCGKKCTANIENQTQFFICMKCG